MMISGSRSGHLQLRTSTTTTHAGNNGTFHDQQVPPSPTLTNPDMILPFDHDERESSTPSPPFNLPTLEQLQSLHRRQASGDSLVDGSQIGVAISSQDRPDTRPFPRPRWPFEGHEATSRRLSAIGEEDSASPEQVKRRTSGLAQHATHAKRGLTGSPAFRRAADEQHRHMDGETVRSASSSSSTVSANGSGSGSGSASSHGGTRQSEDWESPNDNSTGEHLRNSIMSVSEKDGPKEDPSSAILSTEAERILENAKKRLSVCAGPGGSPPYVLFVARCYDTDTCMSLADGRKSQPSALVHAPVAVTVVVTVAGQCKCRGGLQPARRWSLPFDFSLRSQAVPAPSTATEQYRTGR